MLVFGIDIILSIVTEAISLNCSRTVALVVLGIICVGRKRDATPVKLKVVLVDRPRAGVVAVKARVHPHFAFLGVLCSCRRNLLVSARELERRGA